jgi:hypothetical protein
MQQDVILDNEIGFKLKNISCDSKTKVEQLVKDKDTKYKNIHSVSP